MAASKIINVVITAVYEWFSLDISCLQTISQVHYHTFIAIKAWESEKDFGNGVSPLKAWVHCLYIMQPFTGQQTLGCWVSLSDFAVACLEWIKSGMLNSQFNLIDNIEIIFKLDTVKLCHNAVGGFNHRLWLKLSNRICQKTVGDKISQYQQRKPDSEAMLTLYLSCCQQCFGSSSIESTT